MLPSHLHALLHSLLPSCKHQCFCTTQNTCQSPNLNRLAISLIVKNLAVETHIGILNNLGCEEVILYELHVGAFVLSFHINRNINVLQAWQKYAISHIDSNRCQNRKVSNRIGSESILSEPPRPPPLTLKPRFPYNNNI